MSVRSKLLCLLPCLGLALVTVPLAAQNPHENAIGSISYGGSGCPQGSVGFSMSNDRQRATLIFDAFVASKGPSIPVTENRKSCQITVTFMDVQGSNLFEMDTEYRGYAQLADGTTGETSATYTGVKQVESESSVEVGPASRDYLKTDSVKQSNRNSRTVVIKAQTVLTGGSGQSQRTIDSIDFKVTK